MENTYVAIMAGGIGSRFWPQSRTSLPKQFLDILGTGNSLIQSTYDRFIKICPPENIYILTNEAYKKIVKKQLPKLKDSQILGEPMRKNTAPAIAYFAHKIHAMNDKANMVISPADHLVKKESVFIETINKALAFTSKNDSLVTMGIKPTRPDTGYGYIQFLEEEEKEGAYRVKTFTEKPSLKLAKTFISSGEFLWNSGIFIWSSGSILQAFETHLPEVYEVFVEGTNYYNSRKESAFINKAFSMCTNISIDYGVMEKADNVYVFPTDLGWSDLGTWASLYENYNKDYLRNAVSGKNVFIYDAAHCMVMAPDDKLVVLQGLDDFIVIDTEDVLLICHKTKEQEIKQMVNDIKRKKMDRFL